MSEPVGTLQVSVIEGRNIKAKKGSLEFMVKVALDSQQPYLHRHVEQLRLNKGSRERAMGTE